MSAEGSAVERLWSEAKRVRSFLATEGPRLSTLFVGFPRGACGNACDVLASWLRDLRVAQPTYVWGTRDTTSHGWLETGGIVVDITSDQFRDGLGAIYVGRPTPFHSSFAPLTNSTPSLPPQLAGLYAEMSTTLRADI